MIQFKKIIPTYLNGKVEDIFACDCMLDDLFKILFSNKKINYDEIIEKFNKEKSHGFFFF